MVVGESGLGKSTLINSLFYTQLYRDRKLPDLQDTIKQTVSISAQQVDVEEKGVKLKLTVVDTPGFGESLDSAGCIEPILTYIDEQYERFLDYENGLNRRHMVDSRVHCCFYFISPIGHGLKPLDIQFMKQLHTKVSIVPLIAKADCLTRDEVAAIKKQVLADIQEHQINIYTMPDCEPDEEPEFQRQLEQIKQAVPFAISSSIEKHELDGRLVFARKYPFGTVEIENPDHSDFVKLRSMLVSHMQDLREVTNELHYENYRSMRLATGYQLGNVSTLSGSNFSTPNASSSHLEDDRDRMLREKEQELKRMQEMLAQMQQQMKIKTETIGWN